MSLLPNAEFAFVPIEKLTEYALNPEHPVGKHKAAVFEAILGITITDADFLREKIMEAILTHDVKPTRQDEFGQRYQMEFEMERNGRSATILTSWILEPSELSARLTSCYVK
ncbi:MAG: DUF6883 domain-containing protein [Saprospiraceae bacterium]